MIDRAALEAVEASDTDALLRIIDGWCGSRRWEDLVGLRPHLSAALERGKQLWAIDEHIRFRLALEGPHELAGAAVAEGPTRFTLGPLTEVVAQNRTWGEIAPHLGHGPHLSIVAHERAIRGDHIDEDTIDDPVYEIPHTIQSWEPGYCLAEYKSDRVETPSPPSRSLEPLALSDHSPVDDAETVEALLALTAPWVEQSTGRAEARAVEGDATGAIAALGVGRAWRARIEPADALAWMAWAAASSGAHGRRRGAAAGRYSAWWAAAALCGVDWPADPPGLGRAVDELDWFVWSDGDESGWHLRLAISDPIHGLGWAISAVDLAPGGDER